MNVEQESLFFLTLVGSIAPVDAVLRALICYGYEEKFLSDWSNLQSTFLILCQSQSHSLGSEDMNQVVLNSQTNRAKIVMKA